jgi:Flp pilus assembly protein TadG
MPRRRRRDKGGQAIVEFALIAPIMITRRRASIDRARVCQARITHQSSTRDAAEYAASAATDAATAQSGARRVVCSETQYLPGFQAGATVAECVNPTVVVTAWSRTGTAVGATADTPLASATVTASMGFSMLFSYPFLPKGTWTLSADQSYAIIQGR